MPIVSRLALYLAVVVAVAVVTSGGCAVVPVAVVGEVPTTTTSSPARPRQWGLLLERGPGRAGDHYALTAHFGSKEHDIFTLPDGSSKVSDLPESLDLVADVTLADGSTSYSVRRFDHTGEAGVQPLGEVGRTIVETTGADFFGFAYEAGNMPPEAQQAMTVLMHRGPPNLDELLGHHTRADGERWKPNLDVAHGYLGREFTYPRQALRGEAQLSVRTVDGVECLHLESRIHVDDGVNWKEGPPGKMKIERMKLELTHSIDCPIDSGLPCLDVEQRLSIAALLIGELQRFPGQSKAVLRKERVQSTSLRSLRRGG